MKIPKLKELPSWVRVLIYILAPAWIPLLVVAIFLTAGFFMFLHVTEGAFDSLCGLFKALFD